MKVERFESIQESVLSKMLRERQELRIQISDEVLGFSKHIPNVSFAKPTEVAPSSAVFTAEAIAQVILYTRDDLNGKYVRFVIGVYSFGGKILYTAVAPGLFEAHVTWPAAQQSVQPDRREDAAPG